MGSYSEDGRGGGWGVASYLVLALAAGTCGPGAILAWRVSEDRALLAVVVGGGLVASILTAGGVAAFAMWRMLEALTEHRGARVERARTADLYTRAADRGGRGVVTIEAPRRYLAGGPAMPDAAPGPGAYAEAPEDDLGDVLTWAPPPAAGAVSLAPPPPRRNGTGGAA